MFASIEGSLGNSVAILACKIFLNATFFYQNKEIAHMM